MERAQLEWPACPACGSDERRTLYDDVGRGPWSELGLAVCSCSACGLGYLRPRVRREDLLALDAARDDAPLGLDLASLAGSEDTARRAHAASSLPSRRLAGAVRFVALWRKVARQCAIVERAGPPRAGERLLDVGCGAGLFLAQAERRWACAPMGVDLAPACAAATRRRVPGAVVLAGALADVAVPTAAFAVCTIWSCLEHDPEPARTLSAVRRALGTRGLLVIEVPDAGSATARLLGRDWPALEAPHHVCHFTQSSLRRLVEARGFCVQRVARGGTAAWQLVHSELLLGLLLRHQSRGAVRRLLHLEARSATAQAALLLASSGLRLAERGAGLGGRLILVARAH